MNQTPMQITLYGPDDDVKAKYTRPFVPWKLLKAAVRLAKKLGGTGPNNLTEDDVDELARLVVEVFGNKFTVDELNEGADVSEMIAVLNTIIAKASGGLNPTPPPGQ